MKTTYWISTSFVSLFLLWSAFTYFFSKPVATGFRELGFPDYFRIQLAVLKMAAVLVLLLPTIPIPLKEWAYAGTAFFLLTAFVAHVVHKDSIFISLFLILILGILITSNVLLHRIFQCE